MTATPEQRKNPWFPRASEDGSVTFSAQQFDELIALLNTLLAAPLGNVNCPPVRVCGTPVNGYHIQWNTTGNQAEWAPSATTFLGLTDTPASFAGHALKVLRVNALGTAVEFHSLITGATNFLGLTDTPGSYAGAAGYFLRVNGGGTGVEFVAGGSGDFVGPASAIDGSIVLFDGGTGKLGKQGPELSLGGLGAADSLKVPQYNTEGQLRASVVGSSTPALWAQALGTGAAGTFTANNGGYAVFVVQAGIGSALDLSSTGNGVVAYATAASGVPYVAYRLAGTADLATLYGNIGGTIGLRVLYHGGLTFLDTAGRDHTRTSLGLDTAAYQPASAFEPAGAAAAAQAAAESYADGLVVGLFDDRGNYDASTNLYPSTGGSGPAGAILKGDVWRISVAGTLGGITVDVGDSLRALVDAPAQVDANWALFEANTQQATESQRGTLAIATQAEAEDSLTTNDIDAITPIKWWRAWSAGLLLSDFLTAVRDTVLTGLSVAVGGAITSADSILAALGKLQNQVTGLGTSKQDADADLTQIAGLTPANDDILQRKAGAWTNRTMAQLASDLALETGAYNSIVEQPVKSVTTGVTTSWTTVNSTDVEVVAGSKYTIRFVIYVRCTSTSGGINIGVTGPSSPTFLAMRWTGTQGGGNIMRTDINTYDSVGSLAESSSSISSTKYTAFEGIIQVEPSANGTVSLRIKRGGAAGTIDVAAQGSLSILTS